MTTLIDRQRSFLNDCMQAAQEAPLWQPCGRLLRVTGMVMVTVPEHLL